MTSKIRLGLFVFFISSFAAVAPLSAQMPGPTAVKSPVQAPQPVVTATPMPPPMPPATATATLPGAPAPIATATAFNCGCTEANIKCLLPEDFDEVCKSVSSSAAACAQNKPQCTIYLTLDTCRDLGLSTTTSPIPPPSTSLDCSVFVHGVPPDRGFESAKRCCMVRHESVHVIDPECRTQWNGACAEKLAYNEDENCIRTVAQAICHDYPNSHECAEACFAVVQRQTIYEHAKCLCEAGAALSDPSKVVNIVKACGMTCLALISEKTVPPGCPATYPPVGDVQAVALYMCEQLYVGPAPNATPMP